MDVALGCTYCIMARLLGGLEVQTEWTKNAHRSIDIIIECSLLAYIAYLSSMQIVNSLSVFPIYFWLDSHA